MYWFKIIAKYVVIGFFLYITLLLINQHLFSIVVYYTGIPIGTCMVVFCLFFIIFVVIKLFKNETQKALLYFFLLVAFIISLQKDVIHMRGDFDGEYMHHRRKGLLNKWGKIVIPGCGRFWKCSSNDDGKEIIVGVCREKGYEQIKVYKNGEVISVINYDEGMKESDGPSVYDYITENIGKPISGIGHDYDDLIKHYYIKEIISSNESDTSKGNQTETTAYTDLGLIDCYISDLKDQTVQYYSEKNVHLYAKSYDGKSLFFIKGKYWDDYRPLTKGSWTRSDIHFNARAAWSPGYYYVNVSLWESGGTSNDVNSTQRTIRTENSSQPVQEWVPCPVCGNSGRVGLCQHCNGTGQDLYYNRGYRDCPNCGGLKKCTTCGGSGGHYETRFR